VQNLGAGDMVWDCEYQTIEHCAPQVVAGNRGFCNLNPAWSPPPGAAPRFYRKRHQSEADLIRCVPRRPPATGHVAIDSTGRR
jgi:hypothetical protein